MALATYSDLTSALADWLKRTDLTARIPDFIRLTEARLNRLLRDPDMIVSGTLSFTNGTATLPAEFGELIAFGPTGRRLSLVTAQEFGTYEAASGDPTVYSVIGGSIKVLPSQGSASTPYTYFRGIPALTVSNTTNWLMTRAPDLYLYGSLLQAEMFGWNDERLPMLKSAFDEGISELRTDGDSRRWGVGMSPKVRRT